jgi:hypothetical protein
MNGVVGVCVGLAWVEKPIGSMFWCVGWLC